MTQHCPFPGCSRPLADATGDHHCDCARGVVVSRCSSCNTPCWEGATFCVRCGSQLDSTWKPHVSKLVDPEGEQLNGPCLAELALLKVPKRTDNQGRSKSRHVRAGSHRGLLLILSEDGHLDVFAPGHAEEVFMRVEVDLTKFDVRQDREVSEIFRDYVCLGKRVLVISDRRVIAFDPWTIVDARSQFDSMTEISAEESIEQIVAIDRETYCLAVRDAEGAIRLELHRDESNRSSRAREALATCVLDGLPPNRPIQHLLVARDSIYVFSTTHVAEILIVKEDGLDLRERWSMEHPAAAERVEADFIRMDRRGNCRPLYWARHDQIVFASPQGDGLFSVMRFTRLTRGHARPRPVIEKAYAPRSLFAPPFALTDESETDQALVLVHDDLIQIYEDMSISPRELRGEFDYNDGGVTPASSGFYVATLDRGFDLVERSEDGQFCRLPHIRAKESRDRSISLPPIVRGAHLVVVTRSLYANGPKDGIKIWTTLNTQASEESDELAAS